MKGYSYETTIKIFKTLNLKFSGGYWRQNELMRYFLFFFLDEKKKKLLLKLLKTKRTRKVCES